MTAVDSGREGTARRWQIASDVAVIGLWLALAFLAVGMLGESAVISPWYARLAPVGILLAVPSVIVTLAGGQLAERYREPADGDEVP